MPKDRFSVFLDGYTKKFTSINLRHHKASSEVDYKVNGIIRRNIALGHCNIRNIKSQHISLMADFNYKIKEKYLKELKQLEQWQSDTLQKLFPELNE